MKTTGFSTGLRTTVFPRLRLSRRKLHAKSGIVKGIVAYFRTADPLVFWIGFAIFVIIPLMFKIFGSTASGNQIVSDPLDEMPVLLSPQSEASRNSSFPAPFHNDEGHTDFRWGKDRQSIPTPEKNTNRFSHAPHAPNPGAEALDSDSSRSDDSIYLVSPQARHRHGSAAPMSHSQRESGLSTLRKLRHAIAQAKGVDRGLKGSFKPRTQGLARYPSRQAKSLGRGRTATGASTPAMGTNTIDLNIKPIDVSAPDGVPTAAAAPTLDPVIRKTLVQAQLETINVRDVDSLANGAGGSAGKAAAQAATAANDAAAQLRSLDVQSLSPQDLRLVRDAAQAFGHQVHSTRDLVNAAIHVSKGKGAIELPETVDISQIHGDLTGRVDELFAQAQTMASASAKQLAQGAAMTLTKLISILILQQHKNIRAREESLNAQRQQADAREAALINRSIQASPAATPPQRQESDQLAHTYGEIAAASGGFNPYFY